MKRWAILTVLLYAVALLTLTVPLVLFYGLKFTPGAGRGWQTETSLAEALEVYRQGGYWVWLGVTLAAQALLLFVPVKTAERRPSARRPLVVPLLTASFLLANLALAGGVAVMSAIWGDDAGDAFDFMGQTAMQVQSNVPILKELISALRLGEGFFAFSSVITLMVMLWMIWGLLFYRSARADDPHALSQRAVRWLLRGSILELLVAVPCHIVVRTRDTCCAQAATFWGIVTGISVMLMAFGPGVFFLFAERCRRLRPHGREAGPPVIGKV